MRSSGGPRLSTSLSGRELEAQELACSYLVKGCERALYQFGLVAGETGNDEGATIDQRAADIMRDVLGSWRETLSLLRTAPPTTTRPGPDQNWMLMKSPGTATPAGDRSFD
jgi:hypothetical protein